MASNILERDSACENTEAQKDQGYANGRAVTMLLYVIVAALLALAYAGRNVQTDWRNVTPTGVGPGGDRK